MPIMPVAPIMPGMPGALRKLCGLQQAGLWRQTEKRAFACFGRCLPMLEQLAAYLALLLPLTAAPPGRGPTACRPAQHAGAGRHARHDGGCGQPAGHDAQPGRTRHPGA